MVYLFSVKPEGFKEFDIKSSDDDHIYTMRWTGDSKVEGWRELELSVLEDDFSSPNDTLADIASFKGGSYALSQRAKDVLTPVIGECVEFLPALYDGEPWYILNVVNVLDIVDKEKSRHKIYKSGKVGFITHAFLNAPSEPVSNIFIAKDFHPYVFINEETKQIIESTGLTGALIREYKNP